MLPSLLVAATLTAPGAPIPRDTTPNTTGPAPRVLAVKADGTGAVWITAQVWEKRKVMQNMFVNENGKQVMKQQEVEQSIANYIHKSLTDFGAKFSTANGSSISTDDAVKRVKNGATLLITADGKPIDKGWLRAVSGDTVVMQTDGLAHAQFQYNQYNQANSTMPTTASPRLAMFCADQAGDVKVAVNANPTNNYGGPIYIDDGFGGGRIMRGGRGAVWQGDVIEAYGAPATAKPGPDGKKLLADVKFDTYTMDGRLVPRAEAMKRLKAGGLVLLAGDTKFPDANYLKAFHEELLVLVSGEFVFPPGIPNPYDMLVKSTEKAGKTIGEINDGTSNTIIIGEAVQLKALPAIIKQVAPAAELPAPKPAAKPAEKPAGKPAAKPPEAPAKPAPKGG